MHAAALGGHLEIIKCLVPKFRDRVHERGEYSFTALHYAAQEGHCEVVRYLIEELKMDPLDQDEVCGVLDKEKV